jgi:hypothetical protein
MVITALLLLLPFMPWLPRLVLHDATVRHTLLEVAGWGIPILATCMVGLHALYGLLADVAARREGSRRRGRGLRFGLYGCAWDVITMPLGLLIIAVTQGLSAAGKALPLGLTAPGQAIRSYLASVHGLPPDRVKGAAVHAGRLTALSLLGLVVLALLLGVAALLR